MLTSFCKSIIFLSEGINTYFESFRIGGKSKVFLEHLGRPVYSFLHKSVLGHLLMVEMARYKLACILTEKLY